MIEEFSQASNPGPVTPHMQQEYKTLSQVQLHKGLPLGARRK